MALIQFAHLSVYDPIVKTGGPVPKGLGMTNTRYGASTRTIADHGTPPVLIDFKQVSTKVCMGRSRIYGLIGEGKFPPPVKIGASSRWIQTEIDAYIATLAATRDSELTGG